LVLVSTLSLLRLQAAAAAALRQHHLVPPPVNIRLCPRCFTSGLSSGLTVNLPYRDVLRCYSVTMATEQVNNYW